MGLLSELLSELLSGMRLGLRAATGPCSRPTSCRSFACRADADAWSRYSTRLAWHAVQRLRRLLSSEGTGGRTFTLAGGCWESRGMAGDSPERRRTWRQARQDQTPVRFLRSSGGNGAGEAAARSRRSSVGWRSGVKVPRWERSERRESAAGGKHSDAPTSWRGCLAESAGVPPALAEIELERSPRVAGGWLGRTLLGETHADLFPDPDEARRGLLPARRLWTAADPDWRAARVATPGWKSPEVASTAMSARGPLGAVLVRDFVAAVIRKTGRSDRTGRTRAQSSKPSIPGVPIAVVSASSPAGPTGLIIALRRSGEEYVQSREDFRRGMSRRPARALFLMKDARRCEPAQLRDRAVVLSSV